MARIKITTPKGEAIYPWLNIPDTRSFNGQPSRPAYKVSLRLVGKDIEKLQQQIDPLVDEAYQKALDEAKPGEKKRITKVYPYYPEENRETGEETGAYLFKFKQNAELRTKTGEIIKVNVALFDSKLQIIKDQIFAYSEIKCSFTTRPYFVNATKSAGISCDLSAVQVLKLSDGNRSATSYGFGEEEGGFVAKVEVEEEASAFEDEDDF